MEGYVKFNTNFNLNKVFFQNKLSKLQTVFSIQ